MPASVPDPHTIRQTAEEVLSDPEYQLTPRPDQLLDESLWEQFQDWLRGWWEKIEDLMPAPEGWQRPAALVAAGILLAVAGYFGARALRRRMRPEAPLSTPQIDPALPPDELQHRAEEAGARQEYAGAVRLLLRASILRLEAAEQRINRPGITNRELLRRYRSTPVHDPLARLVETVDLAWYGERECTALDFQLCREACETVRSLARPRRQMDAA
jgi:hypothetical protein